MEHRISRILLCEFELVEALLITCTDENMIDTNNQTGIYDKVNLVLITVIFCLIHKERRPNSKCQHTHAASCLP